MNQYYDEEETKIDKLLLIFRRAFIILFVWFLLWLILFKVLWLGKDRWIIVDWETNSITGDINDDKLWTDNGEFNGKMEDLWKNYSKKWNQIYYKWQIVEFVNTNEFKVITENKKYTAEGMIINSDNLINIFKDYETRAYMMKHIDGIIKNEINVTDQLKWASENGMYKIENDYETLNKFNRNDRYDMTSEQRAKFAIMFLYVKIAKAYSNDKISMKVALMELKEFIENFDEDKLKKELYKNDLQGIRWDIWLDKHCIYVDGKVYACFLDKILLK